MAPPRYVNAGTFLNVARQVFDMIDVDLSGSLDREEILEGVSNNKKVIAFLKACGHEDLQYLMEPARLDASLKAIDEDGDGIVGLLEWEHAIRRALNRKLRAAERRREEQRREKIKKAPLADLREFVLRMQARFEERCKSDGTISTLSGNWERMFNEIDDDGSGRLDYGEFEGAVYALGVQVEPKLLRAFWAFIDDDDSGEVTIAEFQNATYLLVLAGWDDYEEKQLRALVNRLNLAVETRHERKSFYQTQQGPQQEERFNWYKIFVMMDLDGSGRMGYEELVGCIRGQYPCLSLNKKQFSLCWIRGLWKAIDVDRSGDVTVDEFVAFMRRHAPPNPPKHVFKRGVLPTDRQDADLRFPDTVFCHALRTGGKPLPGHRWPRKVFDATGPSTHWADTAAGTERTRAGLDVVIPDTNTVGLDATNLPQHLSYLLRDKSYVLAEEKAEKARRIAHMKRFKPKSTTGSLASMSMEAPFEETLPWLSEGPAPARGPGCAPAPTPAPGPASSPLQAKLEAKRRSYRESIAKTRASAAENVKKAPKSAKTELQNKRDALTEEMGFTVSDEPGVPANETGLVDRGL